MQRELEQQQSSHHASDLSDEVPALRREERTGVSDVSRVLGVTFPAGIDDSEWVRSEKEELDSLAALSFRLNPESVTPDNETPQKKEKEVKESKGEVVNGLSKEESVNEKSMNEKSLSESLNAKSLNESLNEPSNESVNDKSLNESLNHKSLNESSNEPSNDKSLNESLNDKSLNESLNEPSTESSNKPHEAPFSSTHESSTLESEVSAAAHSGDPPPPPAAAPLSPSSIHPNPSQADSLAHSEATPQSSGMLESPVHSSPISSSLHTTEAVPPSASQ